MSGVDSKSIANNFVGREREVQELRHALDEARDGRGLLFLISGEPGIGKSRLAEEVAREAANRDMRVLWGRCWEGDGAPAYWPWIQVVRSYLGTLDPQQRSNLAVESEVASEVIQQVAQIIPDLRPAPMTPSPSVTEKLEPSEARFRLFDAFTNFLKMGARSHPMLIVLDDLHDADEASLALLRFMARELKGAPILIVATYRDREVRRSPSLSRIIGELSRDARPIPLSGLSESEVSRLVESKAGWTPDESLVAKLRLATNGNPLFVDGIVRSLMAEGALGSAGALDHPFKIPSGIREAIRIRLSVISPDSMSLLAVASAIGNEFGFNLCHSAAEVSADEAHRLLDEAASAGIVTALGRGRYRFSHALVRGAVYEELDSSRRILVHGKIAHRLEDAHREHTDPYLAELAHHFREAGLTEKAIDYSVRAGKAANSIFAFNDAMMQLQAAIELLEQHGADARQRADLLYFLAGPASKIDLARSIEYCESAVALYEGIGCFEKAAHLHIGLGQMFGTSGFAPRGQQIVNTARAREHFRRAEAVFSNGPETTLLILLYAAIAGNEYIRMDHAESAAAARRAMEISERLGRKGVWSAAAGIYANCLVASGRIREGFALFDQSFDAQVQTNQVGGATWPAGAFQCCHLGDVRAGRAWYQRELDRPRNARDPIILRIFTYLCGVTYLEEGQLVEARSRLGSERWGIRFWIGGEREAVAGLLAQAAEESDRAGALHSRFDHRAALGGTYHFLGEDSRAEAQLQYGLDNGGRGPSATQEMRARPLLTRVYVAMNRLDVAAEQMARCRELMATDEDWRGRAGDVSRAEAILEAARADYDLANRQFESALAIHQRFHSAWEQADTLECWGRALAAAGDHGAATQKFDAAIEIYRSRGAHQRFVDYVMADKLRVQNAPAASA